MTSKRGLDQWLPSYVLGTPARHRGAVARRSQLTHVFFLICDHYEPRHGATRDEQPVERVRTWQQEYPRFQERCRTAFGHAPLHTWFYPPHHGAEHLPTLADMAFEGGGEVELHYHHEDDTEATLRRDLLTTLDLYNRSGLLLETGAPPRRNFGFVHGDWTLDNACNGVKCGVNGELSILKDLGCWADFTMPSANEAQTRKINSIYYAMDDPSKHKSHDRGVDAAVGAADREGFLLIQGPLGINWSAPRYPRVENASLTSENWGRPDRIHKWIDCNVHVQGRPDWLFVKLHTHGAVERDFDALFGDKAFEMHRVLNEQYNDGTRYQLHYVTARQAYNLVKAAEAGHSGDPRPWLDHTVRAPVTSLYALDSTHRVLACEPGRLEIDTIASSASVCLKTRVGDVRQIEGRLSALRIDAGTGCIHLEAAARGGEIVLRFGTAVNLATHSPDADAVVARATAANEWTVRLPDSGRTVLHAGPLAAAQAA
jgi:hypothetical protein